MTQEQATRNLHIVETTNIMLNRLKIISTLSDGLSNSVDSLNLTAMQTNIVSLQSLLADCAETLRKQAQVTTS